MTEDINNQDEGSRLPPAPTTVPGFTLEWPEIENPESLPPSKRAILSGLSYLAAQNNILMVKLEDMRIAMSRTRSRRGNMSFAAASTEGGDDTSIAPILSDRVQEAFNELRTGELREILTALHDSFVTVNNKKLHVQRIINVNKDARTFIEHVTEVMKEKQASPEGQEEGVAENHEKMLGRLANLTPGLKMDLYIELNKAQKQ
ncbi:hypothetical protein CEP53_012338 [Fusarium sp. AF-6]|nr:hypothetical protein CEP53_012338 [Fusarium sp. AF-6]